MRQLVFTLFSLLMMFSWADATASAQGKISKDLRNTGKISDGREARFRAALAADGFLIHDGYTRKVEPITDLLDSGSGDSACGNNAGQMYKVFEIPFFPEDPLATPFDIFYIRPDEAIVYVGPTPPRADYFSFDPYVWVRSEPTKRIAKGDWIFAAVNDPLNNALIKTEGNGNPFHKQTIVIFTADKSVYTRVADLAEAAGYPESMINSYVLPSALLNLGLYGDSPDNDSLLILLRSANFTSKAEGDRYLQDDFYASIWRLTPDPPSTFDPFDTPEPRNRKGNSEASMIPGLQDGLERLRAAILNRTQHVGEPQEFESVRWWPDSRDVIAETDPSSPIYHKFVAGEGSDTTYLRSAKGSRPANFTVGNDDMVVVYGVNHAATGLATYSTFAVYGDWITSSCDTPEGQAQYLTGCGDFIWNGVVGETNHDFSGSAEQYIPGDPMAPYLYAVKVLRLPPADKHEKYWVLLPETAANGQTPNHAIALDRPVTIGYRAYLNPLTKAGPDYDDIISDRAIWFKISD